MACGLPVVVTNYGAALDFCGPDTAYLIPARETRSERRALGDIETVDYPWHAEVDIQALIDLMRRVYRERSDAKAVGARASMHIRRAFTWEHAAQRAEARLFALREQPPRRECADGAGRVRECCVNLQ
jgi:glycosyltransferase involved in cell wall biosynthesis